MTFHAASNHGAALQAYALQTYLRKMGHDPFFINYQYGNQLTKGVRGLIGRTPGNTLEKLDKRARLRPFFLFQGKWLNVGRDYYNDIDELCGNPPEADVYLCGSDQVWNPQFLTNTSDEHAFWLDFGGRSVRRIAYAPSFGVTELSEIVGSRYACLVKSFDAVSIREKSGLEILEKIGRNDAVVVPDPTLLLQPDEYTKIELNKGFSLSKPYIFSYQLKTRRSSVSIASEINNVARNVLGFDLYHSYTVSFFYNVLFRRYLNPGEWLHKLRNSSFVVTNSFHGTVFSLLFHRPFVTILRQGASSGMNGRIESLLDCVGLQHRTVADFDVKRVQSLCREEINWQAIDEKVASFRLVGHQFLERSLV